MNRVDHTMTTTTARQRTDAGRAIADAVSRAAAAGDPLCRRCLNAESAHDDDGACPDDYSDAACDLHNALASAS